MLAGVKKVTDCVEVLPASYFGIGDPESCKIKINSVVIQHILVWIRDNTMVLAYVEPVRWLEKVSERLSAYISLCLECTWCY